MEMIFTAVGAPVMLVLEAIDSELFNDVTVSVEHGEREVTDKEGDVKRTKGFRVFNERCEGFSAKPDAAINAFLKSMKYGTKDSFSFDLDSEFFQTKKTTNVTKGVFDGPDAEKLLADRIALQDEVDAAYSDEGNAQNHWRAVGFGLLAKYDELGTRKRVEEWAAGGTDGEAAPWLLALGANRNALAEATAIAKLSEAQYEVLPSSMTRGKTVVKFINAGTEDAIDAAATAVATMEFDEVDERRVLSAEQVTAALDAAITQSGVQEEFANIESGYALLEAHITATKSAYDARGYSKHDEDDASRSVAQRIIAAHDVLAMVDTTLDATEVLAEAEALTDESVKKKALRDARSGLYQSRFHKRVINAVERAENARAAELEAKRVKAEGTEAEAFKGAKSAIENNIDAAEMAARIWATMRDHPAYMEVYAKVGILAREQSATDKAAKAAVKAAAE